MSLRDHIHELENYVEEHIAAVGATIGGALHEALDKFVEFVDHAQGIRDAQAILTAAGYTVIPPVSASKPVVTNTGEAASASVSVDPNATVINVLAGGATVP